MTQEGDDLVSNKNFTAGKVKFIKEIGKENNLTIYSPIVTSPK